MKKILTLFKRKSVKIGFIVIVAFLLGFSWLLGVYQSPFPPAWIGIAYYSVDLPEEISLEQLSQNTQTLISVQTAGLIFRPKTDLAKELLPEEFVVPSFTLSDLEALRIMVADTVARQLAGAPPNKQQDVLAILSDPESHLALQRVVVAVGLSANIDRPQQITLSSLKSTAQSIEPSVYDEAVAKLAFSAPIKALDSSAEKLQNQATTSENSNTNLQNFTVEKTGGYRVYKSQESLNQAQANPEIISTTPFTESIVINDQLIPLKAGRSPLLKLDPGTYQTDKNVVFSPIEYYLAVQTANGLPYTTAGIGHAWSVLAYKEQGWIQPLMTMSLFNSLDEDNKQRLEWGELTNIATYTNLWINHPDDWNRAINSLNRIPIPDGDTRTHLMQIEPSTAQAILFKRRWYLPQYATQELYLEYLKTSLEKSDSLTNKLALLIEIAHVNLQNIMNKSFWGAVQIIMNGTWGDTRYNGVTSNCVSYSTAIWNVFNPPVKYDPRILWLVPAPGQLFVNIDPNRIDTIDLPDEDSLPEDQRGKPFTTEK